MPTETRDELLAEIYAAVHPHAVKKRETDSATLTRIVGKVLTRLNHPRRNEIMEMVRAEHFHLTKERKTLSWVFKTFPGSSKLVEGDDNVPLIALRLDGQVHQIDGGKRVRRWRERGREGDPAVIFLELVTDRK